MKQKLQLGVLISGRGSNMEAIINNCISHTLEADVAIVISNKKEAKGLQVAEKHHIPTAYIEQQDFDSKESYEKAIKTLLLEHSVDLVILAGYMKLVGQQLLNAFPNKIMNIHPSLLPKFKGLDAQKQALDAKEDKSGCTVHFVDASLDGGPIILQKSVPIFESDSVDTLSKRILEQEHIAYSEAIQLYCQNKINKD